MATTEERKEAMAAGDAYFKGLEADPLGVPAMRDLARKPNPLFPIFYADGYLAGRAVERERHQSLRVAAKVMLKAFERSAFDPVTVQKLMPGVLTLRAALRTVYGNDKQPDQE